MNWFDVNKTDVPEGIELLLYNEVWINEDFNSKGIRIGFLDGDGTWITAYWCNYHDEYHTRRSDTDDEQFKLSKGIDQIPTYWTHISEIQFPKTSAQIIIK